MWRRGTTSTWSGAAGWMSLKATVVGCLVHDLGRHVTRHDPAEEAVGGVGHAPGSPSLSASLITAPNLPAAGSLAVTMGAPLTAVGLPGGAATVPSGARPGAPRRSRRPSRPAGRSGRSPPSAAPTPARRRSTRPRARRPPPAGASVGRSPLSWARTTSPGPPSAGSSAKGTVSPTSGSQTRRHWAAASRATRRSRSTRRLPAGAVPADHAALGAQRHDPVDAQLGQLLDHPFGALPLDRREGDRQRGLGPGLGLHGAVAADARRRRASGSSVPCAAPRRARPAAPPVGHDHLLAVAQPQHPAQVVGVVVGEHRVRAGRPRRPGGRGRPHGDRGRRSAPALAKGGAQAREHALAAPVPGGGDLLAA